MHTRSGKSGILAPLPLSPLTIRKTWEMSRHVQKCCWEELIPQAVIQAGLFGSPAAADSWDRGGKLIEQEGKVMGRKESGILNSLLSYC